MSRKNISALMRLWEDETKRSLSVLIPCVWRRAGGWDGEGFSLCVLTCYRAFVLTTVGHIGQMGLRLPRSEAAPPLRGGKADINIYKLGYKKLYLCGRETA